MTKVKRKEARKYKCNGCGAIGTDVDAIIKGECCPKEIEKLEYESEYKTVNDDSSQYKPEKPTVRELVIKLNEIIDHLNDKI